MLMIDQDSDNSKLEESEFSENLYEFAILFFCNTSCLPGMINRIKNYWREKTDNEISFNLILDNQNLFSRSVKKSLIKLGKEEWSYKNIPFMYKVNSAKDKEKLHEIIRNYTSKTYRQFWK
ncbi:MAG: hypothetical protein AB1775_09775 [Bacteroidota bacterium]